MGPGKEASGGSAGNTIAGIAALGGRTAYIGKVAKDQLGDVFTHDMHRIEERPVVKDGQIVARPMMYLALSYDHRLIDGREAVTFLVRVKEAIEDPTRLLIDL